MQNLYIAPTLSSPEVNFSPEENVFVIRGTSSPEDVRAMYYPVIEWFTNFIDTIIKHKTFSYTLESPLRLKIDLDYFNSSSAKFLYDICLELKKFTSAGIPFVIEWYFDEEDIDLKEAGYDISLLVETAFLFIPKNK
jgi:hypothetical protein